MLLAANFEDKAVVQFNSNDTKGNSEQVHINAEKMPDLGNVTNVEGNKATIKIEYNIQNQPNIESVMNFWTKLTHRTTTVTTLPTTMAAPITKLVHFKTYKTTSGTGTAKAETQNDGYVHSREMEYISRILAEYLASQTVPTTTESADTKNLFANYVPTKYWEILNKAVVEEEPKVYEHSEDIKKINATKDDWRSDKVIYNSLIDEDKSKPFKETIDNQLMKIIQETPTSQNQPKTRESKSVERSYAKGFLSRLLRMKNDLFNNGFVIPQSEFETKTTNESNEQQDKSEAFNLFNLLLNIDGATKNNSHNFTMNSKQSTNGSLKAKTMITNEPKVTIRPTYIKKSKVHQNPYLELRGSLLPIPSPTIKYSEQNKNLESVNSQIVMPTELKYSEHHENDNGESFSVKKAIVSQQPAAIDKFAKNQLFKMKNDTFNADPRNKSNTATDLHGRQSKKGPVFQEYKIKAIQEIVDDFDRENEHLIVQDLKPTKNIDSMNVSDPKALPDNVIVEIAEKVKRMVLKDIGVKVTTTTVGTTSSTSTITTSGKR